MALDGAITRGELLLIGVEEFQILLEHEDVFGAIVPAQSGDELGLGCATPDIAMLREVLRIALAGDDGAEDRRPVTPVMSLTTSGSCTFIWTKAFCIRCTSAPALSISVVR